MSSLAGAREWPNPSSRGSMVLAACSAAQFVVVTQCEALGLWSLRRRAGACLVHHRPRDPQRPAAGRRWRRARSCGPRAELQEIGLEGNAVDGARNGTRTRTPLAEAADFKSAASTNFAIRARGALSVRRKTKGLLEGALVEEFGGAIRSRTGLDGFAIRCITALLSRRGRHFQPKRREAEASLSLKFGAG